MRTHDLVSTLAVLDRLGLLHRRDGTPRWQTVAELVTWLETPRGADGRTPAQCLDAGDLDRVRLLAIAVPSPHVLRAPSWVRNPVAPAFRDGAEHLPQAHPPEPSDQLVRVVTWECSNHVSTDQ